MVRWGVNRNKQDVEGWNFGESAFLTVPFLYSWVPMNWESCCCQNVDNLNRTKVAQQKVKRLASDQYCCLLGYPTLAYTNHFFWDYICQKPCHCTFGNHTWKVLPPPPTLPECFCALYKNEKTYSLSKNNSEIASSPKTPPPPRQVM